VLLRAHLLLTLAQNWRISGLVIHHNDHGISVPWFHTHAVQAYAGNSAAEHSKTRPQLTPARPKANRHVQNVHESPTGGKLSVVPYGLRWDLADPLPDPSRDT
jgi:hypothetical protein